jgi:polo-like kinase 1
MVLTNGTLQINNFRDHTKMIICPLLGALSTLSTNKELRTYKLSAMKDGLSGDMQSRLEYALEKVEVVITRELKMNDVKVPSGPVNSDSDPPPTLAEGVTGC